MYLPQHFLSADGQQTRKLIQDNSFATVLSFPKDQPVFINHLPVIFSTVAGEEDILIGHMAQMNPQWKHFQENPQATIIINGAHTYITPTWYKSHDVPTWNYAVAHLHGKIELLVNFKDQISVLTQLVDFYEKSQSQPWKFKLPDDLKNEKLLMSAIISFKFHIEKIDAKFKMSQNRSRDDRQGVIDGLSARTDQMSSLVKAMMVENEKNRKL
jgi:transcriptional regulator